MKRRLKLPKPAEPTATKPVDLPSKTFLSIEVRETTVQQGVIARLRQLLSQLRKSPRPSLPPLAKPPVAKASRPKGPRLHLPHLKLPRPRLHIALSRLRWRRLLLVILLGIVTLALIGGYSGLKYRQLCEYGQLASAKYVTIPSEINLCPNILDSTQWNTVLSNAFDFTLLNRLTIQPIDYSQIDLTEEQCNDQLNPLCWIKGTKPELKSDGGYTSLLLVGLDTRPGGQSGLKNTDSIMVVSLDNSSGRILLTSFPRDLYIYYYNPRGGYVNSKINAVYANYGVNGLRYAVEQIIGRKVQYHAFIYFETFIKLIDKLGGIDILLTEKFNDVYPCKDLPAGYKCPSPRFVQDGQYGLFTFPAGLNHFDSTQALVYARARKYSSDYSRASRQQQVLKAILEGTLKQEASPTERLQSFGELYELLQTDVITDVQIGDIAAVVSIMDKLSGNVARIVADPNLGGLGNIITYSGKDPVFKDRRYKQFQKFVSNIWKFLPYYVETPKVLVVNASGQAVTKESSLYQLLTSGNPYWQVKESTSNEQLAGVRLYDFSNGAKVGSLREIQAALPGSLIYNAVIDDVKQSSYGEDILIVWGN